MFYPLEYTKVIFFKGKTRRNLGELAIMTLNIFFLTSFSSSWPTLLAGSNKILFVCLF